MVCNAPATFQRLMQSTMSEFIFNILLVYLDDLLIYSNSFDQHLTNLRLVFQRLREIGVTLNPEKCQFVMPEVAFLGHKVSADGISTDPDKVAAVERWPTPVTAKDVRSFLGLASYYRRFVPSFAKVAKPLHNLIGEVHSRDGLQPNKNQTRKQRCAAMSKSEKRPLSELWTADCDAAFSALKKALTESPVLGYADYSQEFIVEVDACKYGLGAVLSQVQGGSSKVIAYASRTLRPSEEKALQNQYSSRKLELIAMRWAICDKFRSYLLGHHFTLYTDNGPLAHWETGKFSANEQRWLAEIESGFSFTQVLNSVDHIVPMNF